MSSSRTNNQAANSENAVRQGTYAASTLSVGEARLRNDIKARAPEINWDYAVIQRINKEDLSTTLIPFNLGKAILENDPSQNLELYPGDVLTVFSQQDIKVPIEKQVKFVRLRGRVCRFRRIQSATRRDASRSRSARGWSYTKRIPVWIRIHA